MSYGSETDTLTHKLRHTSLCKCVDKKSSPMLVYRLLGCKNGCKLDYIESMLAEVPYFDFINWTKLATALLNRMV